MYFVYFPFTEGLANMSAVNVVVELRRTLVSGRAARFGSKSLTMAGKTDLRCFHVFS